MLYIGSGPASPGIAVFPIIEIVQKQSQCRCTQRRSGVVRFFPKGNLLSVKALARRSFFVIVAGALLFSQNAGAEDTDNLTNSNDPAGRKTLQGAELRDAMKANPGQAKSLASVNGVDWCQTQIAYDRKFAPLNGVAACPQYGDCDIASNRDAAIPVPGAPAMIIRLKFNIFRNDDGSNAAATQADVDAQVEQLNSDFAPSGISFEYTTEFINNSTYRFFSEFEEGGMKNTYADLPGEQLNVYVVNVNAGWIGVGTFPWDPVALGKMGGTIIHDGTFGAGQKTITHEIGHCLGLWHTHHGVDEVSPCGPCYEPAGGGSGGNATGDLCADTDPTPTNFNCSGPGGNDPCSGNAWGPTDTQNYMGYAPDFCYTEFSPQQWGRMNCWTNDVLSAWQSGVNFTADTTFGVAPLNVDFVGLTNKTATDWSWDFGDGGVASIQSPTHQFGPGVRDIALDLQSVEGPYAALKHDFVAVYADTMSVLPVEGRAGDTVDVQIYAQNYLPLTQIRIPLGWAGPLNLKWIDDVSTVGLRTEYVSNQGMSDIDPFFNFRGTYVITPNVLGGEPPIAPGAGPILTVRFVIPAGATPASNPVSLVSYGANSPNFVYGSRLYLPETNNSTVSICAKAGDADGSGGVNIADVTYLIALIFNGGPTPVPANAGDANCDSGVNITDVTFLIAHIFNSGPAPCSCAP